VDEISGAKRKQNLIEHAEDARTSKQLATAKRDIQLDFDLAEYVATPPDRSKLRETFREFELRDPLRRLEEALGSADAGVLAYLMKPVSEAEVGPAIAVARARFADLAWLRRGPSVSGSAEGADAEQRVSEATRILSERYRLTAAEAAARLRRLARSSRRSLPEIADAIIALERG